MDVELFCFADVVADAVEENVVDEGLGDGGARGGEEAGSFVGCVGGPLIGAGDGEESVPLGEGGQDLEGLGQSAGTESCEHHADSKGRRLV